MIDIHAHILPGLDDGSDDMDQSLEMLRIAQRDGIDTVVATPHIREGVFENTREVIFDARDALARRAEEEGMAITLLGGADIHISADLIERLEKGELPTINATGKYFLLELPAYNLPQGVRRLVFELRLRRFRPIITHPERSAVFLARMELLEEFVHSGCFIQITADSLTGRFGPDARRFSRDLLKAGMAHVIATDCHSIQDRPPVLSRAVEEASKIVGSGEARRMVEELPRLIIEGEDTDPPAPIRRPGLFKRLFG